jgi:HSP20 family protein
MWGNDVADFTGQDFVISVPAINIFETDTAYRIDVAAPGLKKNDFEVLVQEKQISISAIKTAGTSEPKGRYNRKEFNFGSFTRVFTMPDHVNLEGISAQYRNGILEIKLPKKDVSEKHRNRQVNIS